MSTRNGHIAGGKYYREMNNPRLKDEDRAWLRKYEQWANNHNNARHVAFIDETYYAPTEKTGGFYAFSVCVVETRRTIPTRSSFMKGLYKDLRASRDSGRNPNYPAVWYHFTKSNAGHGEPFLWYIPESNPKVYNIIGGLRDGVHHYLMVAYIDPEGDEDTRRRLMEQTRAKVLASTLLYLNQHDTTPVDVAILESRSASEDLKDDEVIKNLKKAGQLPKSFSHIHTNATIEPLLIICDGTGWAYRRILLRGEAKRLQDAKIQQTVLDAYSLAPLSYDPSQHAASTGTCPNTAISPARRRRKSRDYYMLGYNQANNRQANPTVLNAHAVIGVS